MFNDFSVNILGSEYKVYFVDEFPERLSEFTDNADGLYNRYNREIFIKRCKEKDITKEGRERCEKTTLRHELIHAYLSEFLLPCPSRGMTATFSEQKQSRHQIWRGRL